MRTILIKSIILLCPMFSWATIDVVVPANSGLFPCNAGLQHHAGKIVCSNGKGQSCEPKADLSCMCATSSGIGDLLSGVLIPDGGTPLESYISAGGDSYNSMQTADKIFSGRIQDVEFNLGSETLGARYFVQLCYRGPLSQLVAGQDLSWGLYHLKMTLTGGEDNYKKKLLSRFSYSCDLRNYGQIQAPRGPAELNPGLNMDIDSANLIEGRLYGGLNSADFALNSGVADVPRFCVFNVELVESAKGLRDHTRHGGNFTLSADVTKSEGGIP